MSRMNVKDVLLTIHHWDEGFHLTFLRDFPKWLAGCTKLQRLRVEIPVSRYRPVFVPRVLNVVDEIIGVESHLSFKPRMGPAARRDGYRRESWEWVARNREVMDWSVVAEA